MQSRSRKRAAKVESYAPSKKTRSVKDNIRSLERLIQKKGSTMEPDALNAINVRIEELRKSQKDHLLSEKEKKYAAKYRMVKHFERVKITRNLSKIDKQMQSILNSLEEKLQKDGKSEKKSSSAESKKAELLSELDGLEKKKAEFMRFQDYVAYFPKTEKYISLFPTKGNTDGSVDTLRSQLLKKTAEIARIARQKAELLEKQEEEEVEVEVEEDAPIEKDDDFFLGAQ